MPYHNKYQNIFTHMTMTEKMKLYELAAGLQRKPTIVEIGSFLGASTCFLAQGLINCSGDIGRLHCVDTWMNDAMDNVERKDVYGEFLNNIQDFPNMIVIHKELSHEAANKWEGPIDMIFFDGDHSEAGAMTDWGFWSPFLHSGSLVVFHDWDWAPGVKETILKFVHPKCVMFDTLPNLWWGWLK